jgi:hypothetical protein
MGVCYEGSNCSIGFFPLGDFLGIMAGALLGGILFRRRLKDKKLLSSYNITILYSFLNQTNSQKS